MDEARLDDIGDRLSDAVAGYCDEVKAAVEGELDRTAESILDYVRANCPRSGRNTKHLADSFEITSVGSGFSKTLYISSKTKAGLVHLVELGFEHRSGRFVPARPFLRPAYDEFTPKMLDDIREIIGKGGAL